MEGSSAASVEGERARFEAEVGPLMPRLYRLCLALCRDKAEAEDLLQEGLVRAYLHRADFEGRGSLLGWLYGIVRAQFLESRRVAARRRGLLESVKDGAGWLRGWLCGAGGEPEDPEGRACASEEAAWVLRGLHVLQEKYRVVVLLCDVEELGYEEVAGVLGVPVGTVKSRHSRGRAQLAEVLRARGGSDLEAGGRG